MFGTQEFPVCGNKWSKLVLSFTDQKSFTIFSYTFEKVFKVLRDRKLVTE